MSHKEHAGAITKKITKGKLLKFNYFGQMIFGQLISVK